jgi:hypothetical protein
MLIGHVFIIHAEDGSRVSCGVIEESVIQANVFSADTMPIPGAIAPQSGSDGVTGLVTVISNIQDSVSDGVCYQGYAMGLEPNVESFLMGTGSEQCNVTNVSLQS